LFGDNFELQKKIPNFHPVYENRMLAASYLRQGSKSSVCKKKEGCHFMELASEAKLDMCSRYKSKKQR